ERRTPYRDHRAWRVDSVWIRLTAPFLDMDLDPSNQDIQKIAPSGWIIAKNDCRVRINLKGTAVRNLEAGVAVWSRDDHLLGLDFVARVQRPGIGTTEHGNLTRKRDNG